MATTSAQSKRGRRSSNSINAIGASKLQKAQKLFEYLEKGENDKFETLIDQIGSAKTAESEKEIEFILNEWTHGDSKHYLLTKATDTNNKDIVCKILSFGKLCNPDVTITKDCNHWKFCGSTSLIIACHNDNSEIGELLLKGGANANAIDGDNRTTLSIIASKNDVEFAKLLLKYNFDFINLINHTKTNGFSTFHNCVVNDSMDVIKFIFETCEKPEYKNKVKIMLHNLIKPNKKNSNALIEACDKNKNGKMVDFLLNKLNYCKEYSFNPNNSNAMEWFKNNKEKTRYGIEDMKFDEFEELDDRRTVNIDFCDKNGRSAVWYAAKHGSLKIVKHLVRHGCNLNQCDDDGVSALHIACAEGMTKTVKWLVKQDITQCDVNICDESRTINYPPIISAIKNENFECVRAIGKRHYKTIDILKYDGLNEAAKCGNIRILQLLFRTLLRRFDIRNFNDLMNKCDIFNKENLNNLIETAKKSESLGITRLLNHIKDKCISKQNYGLLLAFLDYSSSDASKQNVISHHISMRSNTTIAENLIKYIKLESKSEKDSALILNGINNAINKMIENKDVVNDTLLFIANMIDQSKLMTNLDNALKDVLTMDFTFDTEDETNNNDEKSMEMKSNDAKNGKKIDNKIDNESSIRDQSWYKSVLLDSNIWCLYSETAQMMHNTNNLDSLLTIGMPISSAKPNNNSNNNNIDGNIDSDNKGDGYDSDLESESTQSKSRSQSRSRPTTPAIGNDAMKTFSDKPDYDNEDNLKGSFYDDVKIEVISEQLEKLQKFLKLEIKKQEKLDYKNWHKLITYPNFEGTIGNEMRQDKSISKFADNKTHKQTDYMKEFGTKAKYEQKQLFVDIDTGFNGSDEYDYSAYLTNLIINAHRVNNEFQQACNDIFNSQKLFVKCKFEKAPVKMIDRCKIKTATKYCDRKWPLSANLLDVIRCSVTFDTPNDLIVGMETFEQIINSSDGRNGVITHVIRRKNTFHNISERLDYSDIKLNVIVTVNNVSVIGEIQFLLSFMEEFKNQAHGVYRFLRKEAFFNQVCGLYYGSNNRYKLLNTIATKNINYFEKLMLYFNITQLGFNQCDLFLMLFEQYPWEKGCLLYWQCIKRLNDKKMVSSIVNDASLWNCIISKMQIKKWKKTLLLSMIDQCGNDFNGHNGKSGKEMREALEKIEQIC